MTLKKWQIVSGLLVVLAIETFVFLHYKVTIERHWDTMSTEIATDLYWYHDTLIKNRDKLDSWQKKSVEMRAELESNLGLIERNMKRAGKISLARIAVFYILSMILTCVIAYLLREKYRGGENT
ncbi:hypothetical protein P886_4778 [Alteromonadaceae bacterium 2753L.S.0a.02]|nr:hypothetical protein P886_4778 [Alteromonadaceae bacterium 2753L.S.0a.02]